MAHHLILRDANENDMPAVLAIYAHHVVHGSASFELEPPTLEQMCQRRADVCAHGLPFLVAERDGELVGYGYASLYRPRPAYRFTVEDSVYVREDMSGLGVGQALLSRVIERCIEDGRWLDTVIMQRESGEGAGSTPHG